MASSKTVACPGFWGIAGGRSAAAGSCKRWRSTCAGPTPCVAVGLRRQRWRYRRSHDCSRTQQHSGDLGDHTNGGPGPTALANTPSLHILWLSTSPDDTSCKNSRIGLHPPAPGRRRLGNIQQNVTTDVLRLSACEQPSRNVVRWHNFQHREARLGTQE